MGKWIGAATAKMKATGTLGKFGKATAKKIAAGKKKGGVAKKRAVFAQNMKKLAMKRSTHGSGVFTPAEITQGYRVMR